MPQWLDEHLKWGHPTPEEVAQELGGAQVDGWQNCESWMKFQPLLRRPFLWFFSGFAYFFFAKKADVFPPYYRGLFVWRKERSCSTKLTSTKEMDGNVISGAQRRLLPEGT
jgi:hypothetical protein